MNGIHVYTGESVEPTCGPQLHPVNEVRKAVNLVAVAMGQPVSVCSNSAEFIRAVKQLAEAGSVPCTFYLDGTSMGSDIEPIFEDLNRGIDAIHNMGE